MIDLENTTITMVNSTEDVDDFKEWLGNPRKRLAFDTETGGLEHWKQPLRLVQFGDTEAAWVFRADRWLGVVEEVFNRYDGEFVGQNSPFDIRFLDAQAGIKVPWDRVHDTRNMAHIIDPTKSTSLKARGASMLSPKAKKLQGTLQAAMAAQKWGWADIPVDFPIYWGYAGVDTILTARLDEAWWPEISSQYKDVYELEMEVSRVCSNMEMKGTMIDLDYTQEKYDLLTNYSHQLEEFCITEFGVKPSETQKVAVRLVQLGVDLNKKTPGGDLSLDKDVLDGIEHPLAQAVLNHRKATKIASSYFRNFLEMHDNGVIHCSINTLGARTGRMSIQKPALQTLPRGNIVRNGCIPRPGNTWLSLDFDNIEMRLLAHFCQDPGMLEAALTSDMHVEMAKIAYGDPTIDKKDPRRQTFKNANFAKCLVPGTKILRSDGIWIPSDKLDIGDKVVGFDEITTMKNQRFWRESTITGIERIVSPCFELVMEDGTRHYASKYHRWYIVTGHQWVTTNGIHPGRSRIAKPLSMWDQGDSRDIGWLAGIFDGEGSLTQRNYIRDGRHQAACILEFAQNEGFILTKALAILDQLGFKYRVTTKYGSNCKAVVILGGVKTTIELTGILQTSRLKFNYNMKHRFESPDRLLVVEKNFIGDEEVLAIETSTGTFIAEGYASHNSYVAGVEQFAWTAGMEVSDAKAFLNFYDEKFPGVKSFQRKVENVAKNRLMSEGMAYVKSPLGRRHPAEKSKLYTLVNFLIQGTAADVFKRSLIDLDLAGYGEFLLLPVHDETNCEIPVEQAKDLAIEIQQVMNQNNWSVPLTVSYGMGNSWGEAK